MKKNGFTLIELLAVIVILAIIALIATPIVLNIIEDSKVSSAKRSIDSYANAVQYAVSQLQLVNTTGKIAGTFTTKDGKTLTGSTTLTVAYDGDIVCDMVEVYSDGSIYLDSCKVNGEKVDYTYGTYKGAPKSVSFAEDSWEIIVANVKEGNISAYNVGDTKEIALTGFTNTEIDSNGLYTIRIANTSTPGECNSTTFSQTACGFVIEFVDIITTHAMNSNYKIEGGWRDSEMRAYVTPVANKLYSGTIYDALPQKLKENIIDTYVVGYVGDTNFTSTDKLYLLSPKEVWGEAENTAETETRQLDYYRDIIKETNDFSGVIKKYNGDARSLWLRSSSNSAFYILNNDGNRSTGSAGTAYGVSVAFRIG